MDNKQLINDWTKWYREEIEDGDYHSSNELTKRSSEIAKILIDTSRQIREEIILEVPENHEKLREEYLWIQEYLNRFWDK